MGEGKKILGPIEIIGLVLLLILLIYLVADQGGCQVTEVEESIEWIDE
jgi:hypothetical protein